jgi:hypothetical protein
MLQSKDINKTAELENGFTPRWLEPDFILSSLSCFSFSAVCKHLNPFKQRGNSFESVFSCLISLLFLGVHFNGVSPAYLKLAQAYAVFSNDTKGLHNNKIIVNLVY